LDRGIIDSMGVVELVQFLETEFRVEIRDDDITEDNLGSLAAIASFVAAKENGANG
jgi:acyl carrier protein